MERHPESTMNASTPASDNIVDHFFVERLKREPVIDDCRQHPPIDRRR